MGGGGGGLLPRRIWIVVCRRGCRVVGHHYAWRGLPGLNNRCPRWRALAGLEMDVLDDVVDLDVGLAVVVRLLGAATVDIALRVCGVLGVRVGRGLRVGRGREVGLHQADGDDACHCHCSSAIGDAHWPRIGFVRTRAGGRCVRPRRKGPCLVGLARRKGRKVGHVSRHHRGGRWRAGSRGRRRLRSCSFSVRPWSDSQRALSVEPTCHSACCRRHG